MIAAGAAPLGGHLAHVILFGFWFVVVVAVLLFDHVRGRWRRSGKPLEMDEPAEDLGATAPVHVSMATWPPRRGDATRSQAGG
ncbi:MAG TPA: hypothetical protein VG650_10940 [Mycobacteriales bacterium]|nr:hypothetical protein [Mycobacteriales bacterium]